MTTYTKLITAGALAAALMVAPAFAFAHDGKKAVTTRAHASLGSAVQVFTNGDGDTVVRGARVTAVSSGELTAMTYWLGRTSTWTIDIDSNTEFINREGDAIDLDDINEGDYVSFSGTLGADLTIDADVVKNWSDLEFTNEKRDARDWKNVPRGNAWGFWGKHFSGLFSNWR